MMTNSTRSVCVGASVAADARILTVIQEILVHKRDLDGNLQVGDLVQFPVSGHPQPHKPDSHGLNNVRPEFSLIEL